eukprot:936955-Pyramimonas_sp.AAC.1
MKRRRGKINRWRKVRMRKRRHADSGRGPGIHFEWISSSPPFGFRGSCPVQGERLQPQGRPS